MSLNKEQKDEKKQKFNLLENFKRQPGQTMKHLFSHSLSKVFQTKPHHVGENCIYCRNDIRHKSAHINPSIPLHYQQDILSSHSINKYCVLVNNNSLTESSQNDIISVFQDIGQINRIFSNSHILPIHQTVIQETSFLFKNLKINDIVCFWICHSTENFLTADNKVLDLNISLKEWVDNCNSYVNVYMITDVLLSKCREINIFQLPAQYRYHSQSNSCVFKQVAIPNPTYTPAKMSMIHFSSQNADLISPMLAKTLLKNRCRMSIFDILKQFPDITCFSNNKFNPKTCYFYFG